MVEITPVEIGKNRYAPEGANSVNLYQTSTSEPLTLPQLIAAVTLRIAATDELRAVNQMNRLNAQSVWTNAVSSIIRYVTESDVSVLRKWEDKIGGYLPEEYVSKSGISRSDMTLLQFFQLECDIKNHLPSALATVSDRLDAYAQIKPVAESAARQNQMIQIELKSALSRRDVAYSMSSNTMKSLFTSINFAAGVLRG